jgi:hypothetical protein
MKVPSQRGAAIDMKRMRRWVADFGNYRHSVTEGRVERWLSQFDLPDIDLAARVLDVVDFISTERIAQAYRRGVNALPGWNAARSARPGRWRFVAMSTSAGESGDAMLHRLRHANNLAGRGGNDLFVHKSELPSARLGVGDHIVFVDDFAGTGTQISNAWPELRELLPAGVGLHLLLVAAPRDAIARIEKTTDLRVHADIILQRHDQIFDEACKHFSSVEKETIRRYCDEVAPKSAAEYGGSGLTVVFAHSCPNNSLPILHATAENWEGLFRRYD